MTNPLQKRLIGKGIFNPYQWEGGYNHLFNEIKSYEDVKAHLSKPVPLTPPPTCPHNEEEWKWRENWARRGEDTNERIFLMRNIVPLVIDLFSQEEREDLEKIVRDHLDDNRMCDIGHSTSYADDEDTSTVAQSARCLLNEIRRAKIP